MPPTILGLDIGGANLKAATADKRAVSMPFALWKQPDNLPAALADLVAKFPDADELAVTMTGELCDCFETKRDGVNAILNAVLNVSRSRPIRVWSTDGVFVDTEEARRNYLKVAAANWHATATFAGRFAPEEGGLMIDIGSTTTDIIPLLYGYPHNGGATDSVRLLTGELVYAGVRRTPICAVLGRTVCAELFATTQDVYVVLGMVPESPDDRDTADGRPLTIAYSLARLARMLGGDRETAPDGLAIDLANSVHRLLLADIAEATRRVYFGPENPPKLRTVIVAGAGEFLARQIPPLVPGTETIRQVVSLNDELGPAVSACAPAHAVAVLATEQR